MSVTAEDSAPARRKPTRYRRRLRSRIILSFVLLGFGLTALFAYATTELRTRVENQLLADALNRNIDAYASAFQRDPNNAAFSFEGVKGWVFATDRLFNAPEEWRTLAEGIHELKGVENGAPFAYKLAVRRTPEYSFFLAYDLTQTLHGQQQQNRVLLAAVVVFSLFSLLVGWWAASRVMRPVSELAQRLKSSGGNAQPEALATHFPDDEVGQLAAALDDYAMRLTHVVQRDREFNADVSHELRTPLAVIKGAVELLLSRNERGHGAADVARIAEQLLDVHRAQLGGKPLDLQIEGERGLVVDAPEAAVAVALGNLIGNAVKYTAHGEVVVKMLPDAVEVIDSGPGLTPEDAARLFERGYRGTHAEHSQGGGIGLSIVRRLCALYGWDVLVQPGAERGVVAKLTFDVKA